MYENLRREPLENRESMTNFRVAPPGLVVGPCSVEGSPRPDPRGLDYKGEHSLVWRLETR